MESEITIDNPLPYLGREVNIEKHFQVDGTFESLYAANKWLIENGYDYGSSCAMMPTAITNGLYINLPWKWKNFTNDQKRTITGVLTGDQREGPVYVRIFKI